jgi:hypothetical protein
MKYSLVSREVIADSIEVIAHLLAPRFLLQQPSATLRRSCTKATSQTQSSPSEDATNRCVHHPNITTGIAFHFSQVPGALMPLARRNLIGLTLFGGAAHPGHIDGQRGLDGGSVMEGVCLHCLPVLCVYLFRGIFLGIGALGAGVIDIEDMYKLECVALPGKPWPLFPLLKSVTSCAGTGCCSAMFTACTMASVVGIASAPSFRSEMNNTPYLIQLPPLPFPSSAQRH